MSTNVLHPQSAKVKFVVTYKSEYGMTYLKRSGKIVYFDTDDAAIASAKGKPCWSVGKITKPMGN